MSMTRGTPSGRSETRSTWHKGMNFRQYCRYRAAASRAPPRGCTTPRRHPGLSADRIIEDCRRLSEEVRAEEFGISVAKGKILKNSAAVLRAEYRREYDLTWVPADPEPLADFNFQIARAFTRSPPVYGLPYLSPIIHEVERPRVLRVYPRGSAKWRRQQRRKARNEK